MIATGIGERPQNDCPGDYTSRSMTETEIRYAQTKKELLAAMLACRKFHDYIYGREAIIKTDHKPLYKCCTVCR